MDYGTALEHALDGDALLFTGAGFSRGAINVRGEEFKTARQFASELATQCGLPDNVELPDASEEFAHQRGADQLIELLLNEFQAKTILQAHADIARLVPWKYIYT